MRRAGADEGLIGSRLRAHRLARGLRQADVAAQAGVSAAYLNLIEHNRRRAPAPLLRQLGRVLDVDPGLIAGGPEAPMAAALRQARDQIGEGTGGDPGAFAADYPDWAALVLAQGRMIAALRGGGPQPAALDGDRLETAMTEMVMAATAIRAAAAILVAERELDLDWRDRFLTNIVTDAERLSDALRGLRTELGAVAEATADPQDEVGWLLAQLGHHLPHLEPGADHGPDPLARPGLRLSPAGRAALDRFAAGYAADAAALPLDPFMDVAARAGYAAREIADHLGVAPDRVMRRLATLPKWPGVPLMAVVTVDASGAILLRRGLAGVPLPDRRGGPACPHWPVFAALSAPGRWVQARLRLAGGAGPELVAEAWGEAPDATGLARATMLLRPDPSRRAPPGLTPVGPGCSACPEVQCPDRRPA
jgi:hypothetical protein